MGTKRLSRMGQSFRFCSPADLWQKSGGEKLEEFYLKWYDDNKDTAFLAKDMWKFIQN